MLPFFHDQNETKKSINIQQQKIIQYKFSERFHITQGSVLKTFAYENEIFQIIHWNFSDFSFKFFNQKFQIFRSNLSIIHSNFSNFSNFSLEFLERANLKSERFLKLTGLAKHTHTRILHRLYPRLQL